MLFELRNDDAERVSHCGVLEFVAEEGRIYMPYWVGSIFLLRYMYPRCYYLSYFLSEDSSTFFLIVFTLQMMENMLLQEGDLLHVKNVTLPKGTYVKLQPHTKDFLDISNPKAM